MLEPLVAQVMLSSPLASIKLLLLLNHHKTLATGEPLFVGSGVLQNICYNINFMYNIILQQIFYSTPNPTNKGSPRTVIIIFLVIILYAHLKQSSRHAEGHFWGWGLGSVATSKVMDSPYFL